jgi:hypothetical protein
METGIFPVLVNFSRKEEGIPSVTGSHADRNTCKPCDQCKAEAGMSVKHDVVPTTPDILDKFKKRGDYSVIIIRNNFVYVMVRFNKLGCILTDKHSDVCTRDILSDDRSHREGEDYVPYSVCSDYQESMKLLLQSPAISIYVNSIYIETTAIAMSVHAERITINIR